MSDATQLTVYSDFIIGQALTLIPVLFLLVAGFFLLEAGSVRSKNATAILMKNILNVTVGTTGFWLVGGGIAMSETSAGGIIGTQSGLYALSGGLELGSDTLTQWMVGVLFCLTASSIVSGSIAERSVIESYIWWCLWSSVLFYPLLVHWCWNSNGWLYKFGFVDFAGSGVVHTYGAWSSVVAVWMIGPRVERFDASGNWVKEPKSLVGHSALMQSMGTVLLVAGFYAFNGTSVLLTNTTNIQTVSFYAMTLINTALGAIGGSSCAILICRFTGAKYFKLQHINMGVLNGSIAICAGCYMYPAWAAFLLGWLASGMYFLLIKVLNWIKLDDPLDAIPVHGGSGFVGVFGLALFANDPAGSIKGAFFGEFSLLYKQLVGYCVISAMGFFSTLLVLLPFKIFSYLRVSLEDENLGCDVAAGQPAYPEVASKGDFMKFREFLSSRYDYADFERNRVEFQSWLCTENRKEDSVNNPNSRQLDVDQQTMTKSQVLRISGESLVDTLRNGPEQMGSTVTDTHIQAENGDGTQ
eukprot:CFRG1088T1